MSDEKSALVLMAKLTGEIVDAVIAEEVAVLKVMAAATHAATLQDAATLRKAEEEAEEGFDNLPI
jgi:hypothetical protein